MSHRLLGPFDDVYALTKGSEAEGQSSGLMTARDAELLERLLLRFLEEPAQREAFRKLLGPWYDGSLEGHRFVRELARRVARGDIVMRYDGPHSESTLPGVTSAGEGEHVIEHVPEEEEEGIRDWKLECHHHTTALAREIIDQGTRIGVVPDKGTVTDTVKIHYKDDFDPPPPALRCRGEEVPKSGASGGYDVYDFEARFDGDVDQDNFLLPAFWSAYQDRTRYIVSGAPSSVTIDVYNPRQYKFEFKFPPLGKVKCGAKLEKNIERSGKTLAVADKTNETISVDAAGWSPSSLTLDTVSAKTGETTKEESKRALLESVAFSIDGDTQEVKVLEYVGAILNFYTACMEIVNAIKENAPKVGWYVDFDLQLMQGAVAIQWYWKEHTDERVFQFLDFNLELKIFQITFELGIGISGLGFKAQVFAQLVGELSVAANAQRNDPDGMPGLAFPVKGSIKGAIGARFEAGNLFKAEGKGETGIEVIVELGINRGRSSVLHFDVGANWTGVKVEATVSGGLFGLGRTKKWERVLVSPRRLGGLQWPKPEPFNPPYMSNGAMRTVFQRVITKGWNVRVIRSVEGWNNDVHWTPTQIATALADKVDQHDSFHRTGKMVEGLAHAVRKDLNALGSRWGRDYVEETEFVRYVNGSELQAHLDGMVNPAAALAAP